MSITFQRLEKLWYFSNVPLETQSVNNFLRKHEIGWGGIDRIDLTQDKDHWMALVKMVMNFWGSIKCWEVLEQLHN
jgi:hypothetical protein